ncbi:SGNH/GDSL hydrolase family protein [Roseisolibacter agri]|nr:SGNH/GDSL hydrolase family protein [Roseisolibacter agri]
MRHIVLLGDSILDNAAYVRGGPDVVAQLRDRLPPGDRATLLAVDGAVTADVARQLARLPADATDLVLSVGGNDALGHVGLLQRRAQHGAEVLEWFDAAVAAFADDYRRLVDALARRGPSATVCTIYEGQLEPAMRRPARAALAIFNDAIQRAARAAALPVIELRDVCTEPADYANPIEPSVQGGAKIAAAIVRQVLA